MPAGLHLIDITVIYFLFNYSRYIYYLQIKNTYLSTIIIDIYITVRSVQICTLLNGCSPPTCAGSAKYPPSPGASLVPNPRQVARFDLFNFRRIDCRPRRTIIYNSVFPIVGPPTLQARNIAKRLARPAACSFHGSYAPGGGICPPSPGAGEVLQELKNEKDP